MAKCSRRPTHWFDTGSETCGTGEPEPRRTSPAETEEVRSAVRCHVASTPPFGRGSNVSRSAVTTRLASPPRGATGRVSLGLEGEPRPLFTRCLAASTAIAPREAMLVALGYGVDRQVGRPSRRSPGGMRTPGETHCFARSRAFGYCLPDFQPSRGIFAPDP